MGNEKGVFEGLEGLANLESERESRKSDEGDDIMGATTEQRRANPIQAMDSVRSKGEELQERIAHLESRLSSILLPDSPMPKEPNAGSQPDPAARSDLMESIEIGDQKLSNCIGYLNSIISRLDL